MSLKNPSLVSLVPGELEKLIDEKLSKANIIFVPEKESSEKQGEPELLLKQYEDEIVAHNFYTVLNFYKYLHDPLFDLLPEILPKDHEYLFMIMMITGYLKGTTTKLEQHPELKKKPQYFDQLVGLFSKEEFERIEDASQKLVVTILEEIKACKIEMSRDVSAEEQQKNIMIDFITALHKDKDNKNFEKILSDYREKADTKIMMDMHIGQRRGEIFGTSCERLLIALQKILIYWDILHNAGYMNISFSNDPNVTDWRNLSVYY